MECPNDYEFGDDIGDGSWSCVVQAVHRKTGKAHAIKILNKAKLLREKMTRFAGIEKEALRILGNGKHPGIVRLYSTFQDSSSLYFVLALARNGDMREVVRRLGSLSTCCARYYAAQILDTVQWMHSQGILHRDLKPENVLLDEQMRIKLTDFGSAFISAEKDLSPRTSTFVGSAAYVSPELLTSKTTSQSSDIWGFACIIYFLLVGRSPFMAITEYLIFKKIEALDYEFPDGFDEEAKDIIMKMLVLDPFGRLGATPNSSAEDLRAHPFFVGPPSVHYTSDLALPTNGDASFPSSADQSTSHSHSSYIHWPTLWTDPVPSLAVGLFKSSAPLFHSASSEEQSNNELANGMKWNDFVNQFSLVEESELSETSKRNEVEEEELDVLSKQPAEGVGEVVFPKRDGEWSNIEGEGAGRDPSRMDLADLTKQLGKFSFGSPSPGGSQLKNSVSLQESSSTPVLAANNNMLERENDHTLGAASVAVESDLPWSSFLYPDESPRLASSVQVQAKPGRLPIFAKTEQRVLVLTSLPRLLCIKFKEGKGEGKTVIKQAFRFTKRHEEDADGVQPVVLGVELRKGTKVVVEVDNTKSFVYALSDQDRAARWVEAIQRILASRPLRQSG